MLAAGVEVAATPMVAHMEAAVEAGGRRTKLLGRTGDQHAALGTEIQKKNDDYFDGNTNKKKIIL